MARGSVVPPRFGAWTLDARCRVHRFGPFVHGSAPDPLHPATRAACALTAFAALEHDRPRARLAAVPVAALVVAVLAMAMAAVESMGGATSGASPALAPAPAPAPVPASAPALHPLVALAVAVALVVLWRRHFAYRHRSFAAAAPLLTLGRCGACGHPLHGSPEIAPTPEDGDEGARCACAECGAVWPILAAGAPRDDEGRTRTDFPTVEGIDARRTRMLLRRALHADGARLRRDSAGRVAAIQPFGPDLRGMWGFAVAAFLPFVRLTASFFLAGVLLACPAGCLATLLFDRGVGARQGAGPADFLLVGVEVFLTLLVLLVVVERVDAWLRARLAELAIPWSVRRGRCPVCTSPLVEDGQGVLECRCCRARWIR